MRFCQFALTLAIILAAAPTFAQSIPGLAALENRAEALAEGEAPALPPGPLQALVNTDWKRVRAQLAGRAHPGDLPAADKAVSALQSAIREQRGVQRAANEVTGALAPLFALGAERMPAMVHTLDYLQRSIALDVRAANWARAQRDIAAMSALWKREERKVRGQRGGRAAASSFGSSLAVLRDAIAAQSAQATLEATKHTAELVDTLERTFAN